MGSLILYCFWHFFCTQPSWQKCICSTYQQSYLNCWQLTMWQLTGAFTILNVWVYCQISNISHTLAGNTIVDHSDVFGAHCSIFNGLGKDNCKTRQVTFKFWDLVWLILEVWRFLKYTRFHIKRIKPRELPHWGPEKMATMPQALIFVWIFFFIQI